MASPSWPAISAIGERSAANSWRVITPQVMGRCVSRTFEPILKQPWS